MGIKETAGKAGKWAWDHKEEIGKAAVKLWEIIKDFADDGKRNNSVKKKK